MPRTSELMIIGGGLAGCEAAWQAAERGLHVDLFEMRPFTSTGAHTTGDLAELVCSNSLGSRLPDRATGLLQAECRRLGSLLFECADKAALPAGAALAVDRGYFSRLVTERITNHPRIKVVREEVKEIPVTPVIITSGPLTSPALTRSIQALTGSESFFFFDAISPIVTWESIDQAKVFRGSRYRRGEQDDGDYINCPLDQEEYDRFVSELIAAQRIELRFFEEQIERGVKAGKGMFFEGCLPVEILARRERLALAYGPMRPVGLRDPHTGRRPYAVVQLRQDNLAGSLFNLVGFQTNLTFSEQKRVFSMIPGLERAEFVRYGQMHRNSYIASPNLLKPTLQFTSRPDLLFAGQITGVEGYSGNIATGLLAGINAARVLQGLEPWELPATTMLGALCRYITSARIEDFQPMKANYGLLPPIYSSSRLGKNQRAAALSSRALADLESHTHIFVSTEAPADGPA